MIRSYPVTILRSLYLSAMAVSALFPFTDGPVLAAAVNADAALSGLRSAAAQWGVAEIAPPKVAEPKAVLAIIDPRAQPHITEPNLKKLLDLVAASRKQATADKAITRLLGITTGEEAIDLKAIAKTVDEVRHTLAVSQKPGSDDLLLVVARPQAPTIYYLTNTKLVLRAACVVENGQPRLIVNEQAQAGFQSELKFYNDAIGGGAGNA
jgi:hypothetical protein